MLSCTHIAPVNQTPAMQLAKKINEYSLNYEKQNEDDFLSMKNKKQWNELKEGER